MEVINLKIQNKCKMVIPTSYVPGNNVQEAIKNNQIWAPEETNILTSVLSKYNEGIVIDVGSNTGYFSLISLSYNHPTIAIEANPIHKDFLFESIKINNFNSNLLQYHTAFASNRTETVNFDGWSGHKHLMGTNEVITKVNTVQLDSLCEQILFLKIDVEGCEPEVFKSAHKLITNGKVAYIMFELTYIINNIIDKEQIDILHFLNNSNYKLYEINNNSISHINNINDKIKKWEYEYYNTHKIYSPNISTAGCNIIAIYNEFMIPDPN